MAIPLTEQPVLLFYTPDTTGDGDTIEDLLRQHAKHLNTSEEVKRIKGSFEIGTTLATINSPVILYYDGRNQPAIKVAMSINHSLRQANGPTTLYVIADTVNHSDLQTRLKEAPNLEGLSVLDYTSLGNQLRQTIHLPQSKSITAQSGIILINDPHAREKARTTLLKHLLRPYTPRTQAQALTLVSAVTPRVIIVETPFGNEFLDRLPNIKGDSTVFSYVNYPSPITKPLRRGDERTLREKLEHYKQGSMNLDEMMRAIRELNAASVGAYSRLIKTQTKSDILDHKVDESIPGTFCSTHFHLKLENAGLSCDVHRQAAGGDSTESAPQNKTQQRPSFKNHIYVFRGPSTVGKNTLVDRTVSLLGDTAVLSLKHTTRNPREDERHAVDMFFLTKTQMDRYNEDGLYLSYYPFKGNWYALERSIETRFSSGLDVFIRAHVDDDLSEIESRFGEHIVSVVLFSDQSTLERRLHDRKCTRKERQARIEENQRELERIFSNDKRFHYAIKTSAVLLKDGDIASDTEASINETIRKIHNLITWQRYHPKESFVETMVTTLTGFHPHELQERLGRQEPVDLYFDRSVTKSVLSDGNIYDPTILENLQKDGISVLGAGTSWGSFNLYVHAPKTPLARTALVELIRHRLSGFTEPRTILKPQQTTLADNRTRDNHHFLLSTISNARYTEILTYSLQDEVNELRSGTLSLATLEERNTGAPYQVNICLVQPTGKHKPFAHQPYSLEFTKELFGYACIDEEHKPKRR